jgi:type I restriction enzyme, S subunit
VTFPRYPKYKDSGVQWLREVPEHWGFKPLWTYFRRTKRVGFENEQLLSVYRDYGVIPKSSRVDNFNNPSEDLSSYQLVEPGDLVINKMKAWQGSVAISCYRGIVSPAYFVYESLHCDDERYLHYLMRSPQYTAGYLSLSKGIRVNQWDLEPQYHSRMPLLLPPISEQRAISQFLDRETTKIDSLIAEQQRLIELLKEKSQAVISHAVTKGLDPNVPMKDSGVEWLGEVPAHWELKQLRQVIETLMDFRGRTPTKLGMDWGGDIPAISAVNVRDGFLDLSRGVNYGSQELHDQWMTQGRTRRGDVLFTTEAPLGNVALVPDSSQYILSQRVVMLRPQTAQLMSEYLYRLLVSSAFRQGIEVMATGSTAEGVKRRYLVAMPICIPPLEEQRAVALCLERETARIDALVAEAERTIALLQERRTALVSAAVTGKIDVRGLARAEAVAA